MFEYLYIYLYVERKFILYISNQIYIITYIALSRYKESKYGYLILKNDDSFVS